MKVDVFILSFFARNDNISFGWNFVREEWKRSPGWIRQIAEEYSLYLKLELSIPLYKVAPILLVSLGGIHKLAGYC